jgi:hypothetical protein
MKNKAILYNRLIYALIRKQVRKLFEHFRHLPAVVARHSTHFVHTAFVNWLVRTNGVNFRTREVGDSVDKQLARRIDWYQPLK